MKGGYLSFSSFFSYLCIPDGRALEEPYDSICAFIIYYYYRYYYIWINFRLINIEASEIRRITLLNQRNKQRTSNFFVIIIRWFAKTLACLLISVISYICWCIRVSICRKDTNEIENCFVSKGFYWTVLFWMQRKHYAKNPYQVVRSPLVTNPRHRPYFFYCILRLRSYRVWAAEWKREEGELIEVETRVSLWVRPNQKRL